MYVIKAKHLSNTAFYHEYTCMCMSNTDGSVAMTTAYQPPQRYVVKGRKGTDGILLL